MLRKIKRALISVSDKTNIDIIAKYLSDNGVELISTGGTKQYLEKIGLKPIDISEVTKFPEMMDGRVKTLHPLIHGGLLGCLDIASHTNAMKEHNITPIELTIVNLYPFESKINAGVSYEEAIENIDIGGPSMIRSTAKNHEYNTVIVDFNDYEHLIDELKKNDMQTSFEFRRAMAAKAFSRTANYDSAISSWFAKTLNLDMPHYLNMPAVKSIELRYGENPHQKAAGYKLGNAGETGILDARQIGGKELSFNNINDADAALSIIREFEEPATVIIKHANPCGAAIGSTVFEAYNKALDADRTSAFGGVVAVNRELNKDTAEEMAKIFLEVIIAPSATDEALEVLASKKNLRVLIVDTNKSQKNNQLDIRSISGGLLVQDKDKGVPNLAGLKLVTSKSATEGELEDLIFAMKICKHVKSNAIVVAKNGATLGVGAGQMSRIDSANIALNKPKLLGKDSSMLLGAVLASDAFFPFPDSVTLASQNGISAIIQPGGSIKDEEVILTANEMGLSMYFSGIRHFKH